jgi:LemA protein
MLAIVLIALVLLGGAIVAGIVIYNALIRRHLETENAWAHIDVQLKRRYALIPNLVEVVKSYAGHERDTLEKVSQARRLAVDSRGRPDLMRAEDNLAGLLKNLFALAEAYPQMKADRHFQQLQEELKGTENRVSFARQYYNDTVARYNTLVERFPSNLLAGLLGFKPAGFFRAAAGEAAVPQVKT